MHCTTAALDESKYEDIKEDLDEIITALASTFDISVQQHCSNCIKQFTSGPLDAVKPSLQTLNGFSQSCQKKVKVGVQTELVICGPSTKWITLCEETLEKIFDRAESMASKDSGFQEIQENVKIMLSYLESNAVFGGCKRKCIILFFVCDDYESFLNFLHKVECQEYTCYLGDLSNSLQGFFKPRNPISIKSKVTTECLQSALIDIIKTSSNEEEEQRHIVEISSEENIHDNKPMAPRDVNREMKLIKQSKTTLFLNHELISWEALPQMIQTFQGKQFSDSLTKVAGSLSHLYGGEITLKASLNVGAVLEALEESVSDDVTVDRRTIKSESIYAKTPKENDFPLLPVQETPSFELLDPAKKQRRHTIDMGFEIPASQYSKAKVRETSSLKPLSHVKKVRRNTIDIGFGKPALQHSKAKAEQAFAAQTKGHSRDNNEPSCFNEVDPNNDYKRNAKDEDTAVIEECDINTDVSYVKESLPSPVKENKCQYENTLPKSIERNADLENKMTDSDSSEFMSFAGCSYSFVSVRQRELDSDSHFIGASEGGKKSEHVMQKENTESLQISKHPENKVSLRKHTYVPQHQKYCSPNPLSLLQFGKKDRVPPSSVQGIKDEGADSSNGICSKHDEKIRQKHQCNPRTMVIYISVRHLRLIHNKLKRQIPRTQKRHHTDWSST